MKKHAIAGFIVHWLLVPLWGLILPLSTPAYAGLDETIAAIEGLTANGQKVAIIVMQMQTGFMSSAGHTRAFYTDADFPTLIDNQAKLISHFKTNENVYFVNVNLHEIGQETSETFSTLLSTMKESSRYAIWYNTESPIFRDPKTKRRYSDVIKVDIPPPGGGTEAAAAPKHTYYKVEDYLKDVGIQHALIMGSDTFQQSQEAAKELAEAKVEVFCDRELLQLYRHRSVVLYGPTKAWGMKYIQKGNLKEWEALVKKYPTKIRLIEKKTTPGKCLQNPN